MSNSSQFSLKQIFDSFKNKKISLTPGHSSIVNLSAFGDANLFGKGIVTRITHKEATSAAMFATYVGCEFIRDKQYKVLHICLSKHVESAGLNYLANLTKTKIREFKNPNFKIDNQEIEVINANKYLEFLAISGSTKFNTEMMAEITPKIESKEYQVVIIDGLDSVYSAKPGSFFSDVKNAYQELASLAQNNEVVLILSESKKNVSVTTPHNFIDITVEFTKESPTQNKWMQFVSMSGRYSGSKSVYVKSGDYVKHTELNQELCLFEPNPSDKLVADLKAGKLRDKMILGVYEGNNQWNSKDFFMEPNALFVGAMGSGKSTAAVFTSVTWMASNSDQTVLLIIDPLKGASDYSSLFNLNNVIPVLSSEKALIRSIELAYDEAMARRELLNSVESESLTSFEKKTGRKMARMVLMIEEFHSVPYHILNFDNEFKTSGTPANKLHTLMRIGRSLGIWFLAAAQRSTKSDLPPELIPNFTQKQVFRISRAESAYLLGDTKAAEIGSDQKGRCETESGTMQFPYITQESQAEILKEYCKPLNAELAASSLAELKEKLKN